MVQQCFSTLFDAFHVNKFLQNQDFSDSTQSISKYVTPIMQQMHVFDNNTSKSMRYQNRQSLKYIAESVFWPFFNVRSGMS